MRKRELRIEDVRDMLARICDEAGGQAAFARANGLNDRYVSQVISGARPPSVGLCRALGIKPDGMRWVKAKE